MSCSNQQVNNSRSGVDIELNKISEPAGLTYTILEDPYKISDAMLKRGAYIVRGFMDPKNSDGSFQQNEIITVPIDGERKRVYIHKVDISAAEWIGEKKLSKFTIVITVIDNPVPIVPIVYGVSAMGTLVAGWFFVDKVEEFTETSTGSIITLGAAAALTLIAGIVIKLIWK